MSMCYPCDMCKLSGYADEPLALYPSWECLGDCEPKPLVKFAIDYRRDDPHEICKHFKPKEGSDGLDAS